MNFSGSTPKHAGQGFWLALDTATYRPPFLMESMISEVWPLPTHQPLESYYRVDGGDLRALTFPDFIVTARPPVGVLREARAAVTLPVPAAAEPTLAAATREDMALIQNGKPILRVAAPQRDPWRPKRLDQLLADPAGRWLATAYERDDERTLQRVVIWKMGAPDPLPVSVSLAREAKPVVLPLAEPESHP